MLELLRRLRRMRLLTMRGMFCLARAVWITGVTPLTLLKFAAGVSPRATALVDDSESVSYGDLLDQSENLAIDAAAEVWTCTWIKSGDIGTQSCGGCASDFCVFRAWAECVPHECRDTS